MALYSVFPASATESKAACLHIAQTENARLVNRLKNTNMETFHLLCKMHLSFLLHLPGSSLDDFLSGAGGVAAPGSDSATPEKSKFRNFGKRRFGKENKPSEVTHITQQMIDQILPLVNYLKHDSNIKQEGLFRKSGHIGRQKLLKEKLQNGEDLRMELESGIYSAHDCASVLKAFLSELQEPVLTEKHYPAHCQITEMELASKQLQTLQLLLQLLPSENLFLLQCLLSLLHKVALEPANKMTSENLGMLFAPHLLMPRNMRPSELQIVVGDLTKIVTFMIDNAGELFKLPRPLIADIATYWTQREEPCIDTACSHEENIELHYQTTVNQVDAPINTSITFTDRQASQQAATETDTKMELAHLYAYVSSMPSLAKKRKLLKQLNKAKNVALASSPASGTSKHKRTKSFGDSIKKIICRNHLRHGSSHNLQTQQEIENVKSCRFPDNLGK